MTVDIVAVDFANGSDSLWTSSIATASFTVTNATQATNCQITTSTPHGLGVGDTMVFQSIGGMTQLNSGNANYETGTIKRVYSVIDANNFTLDIDSTGFTAYTSGGTMYHVGVQRCNTGGIRIANNPYLVGDMVRITATNGSTQVNNLVFKVGTSNPNNLLLLDPTTDLPVNWSAIGVYSGSGTASFWFRQVTSITKANPAVFTVVGHGFTNGQTVMLVGGDMTEITNKAIVVANATADTFEASGVDSSAYTTYTSGCFVRRPFLTYGASTVGGIGVKGIPVEIVPYGSDVRVRETTAPTQITSSNNTWTVNTSTVGTSASLVASIAVNDFVSRNQAGGNGNVERFYKVTGRTVSALSLDTNYYGTTGTDTASIWHLPASSIPACGTSGDYVIINTVVNHIVEGGYDSTFENSTGQTFLKHIVLTSNSWGMHAGEGTISKINIMSSYAGTPGSSTGGTFDKCSFINNLIYNTLNSGNIINDCVFAGTSSTSYATLRIYENVTFTGSNYIWGATTSATASQALSFATSNVNTDFSNVKCVCSGYGAYCVGANIKISNLTTDYCTTAYLFNSAGTNNYVLNPVITNVPLTGFSIYVGTIGYGLVVEGADFPASNVACRIVQSANILFKDCSWTSGNYHLEMDNYSRNVVCENCTFETPNNYAIYSQAAINSGVILRNCSIDAPSISKAYNIPTGDNFVYPLYILENSFGFSGTVYNRISYLSDYVDYYTTAPSLQIQILSAVSYNWVDTKVVSEYINQRSSGGLSRRFTLRIKRSGTALSGSIVPSFYLNGKKILELSAITSLTTSYDEYTFDCGNTYIVEDGHLELRFRINSTINAIWVGSFVGSDY